MAGSHLLQLLRPHWNLLYSIFICWPCSALARIQMTYQHQCGSLGQGVPHIRNRPMCIVC